MNRYDAPASPSRPAAVPAARDTSLNQLGYEIGELAEVLEQRFDREAAARTARGRTAFGILMVDIDHFKRINDCHGHLVGDAVISQVDQAFAACARAGESIGRYGGVEFLAAVEVRDVHALQSAADRYRRAIGAAPVALAQPQAAGRDRVVIGPSGD